ncbi:MAG: hypothetical protein PUD44_11000 [Clostridiaceae bacterium]|nr:hypothetical protein [Clostridiales bacterium]MDD6878282.1 hypothetical protein [Clostridiaceae bacterium]MDY3071370.1 hypothetical protein [Eubacteriales bacterium]MDY3286827.1 hypothetical protein [Eubacteriales bacterium]MDY5016871.1 hypothetical protein [Eubacteriales bacterium]
MAMEAIRAVTKAEADAADAIAQGKERARRAIAAAHEDAGKLAAARAAQADADYAAALEQARSDAGKLSHDAARYAAGEADAMRRAAEKNIDEAAAFIAERIVKGAWQS